MSGTHVRGRILLAVVSLAAGFILVGTAAADPPRNRDNDYLERVRRENAVKAQQLVSDVKTALVEARRLERTNPAKAASFLEKVLAQLEDDTALPQKDRDSWKRTVETRLRGVRDLARNGQGTQDAEAGAAATRNEEKVRREEAIKRDAANSPTRVARDRIDPTRDIVDNARDLNRFRNNRFKGSMDAVGRSAVPGGGDIEFPADWAKRIAKRKSGPQLTAKEKALLKTLNSTLTINLTGVKFEDVIAYLEDKTGQTILVDKQALADVQVEYETLVTLKLGKVTVRTALRKLLGDLGLTYIIKEEAIQVTSPQRAKESMVVRAYPVGDLVASTEMQFGPFVNQALMLQNVNQLIDLIQSSIDPSSWQINNGPGTITFNQATMSLVIKQSAEIHYTLANSFYGR
jgi:hypothetical protein